MNNNKLNTDTKLNSVFGIPEQKSAPVLLDSRQTAHAPVTSTPYDTAIESIRAAIKTASMTMDNSAAVANAVEEPKNFEAYSATARVLGDLIAKLSDLIDKREKYLADKNGGAPSPTHEGSKVVNNTLVLTTVDAIRQAKKLLQEDTN